MIKKIFEEKKRRYEEMHELLVDPKIISNKAEYQTLAKELSGLTHMVNAYDAYLKILKDIEDIDKVLAEKGHDREFLVLAEEDVAVGAGNADPPSSSRRLCWISTWQ